MKRNRLTIAIASVLILIFGSLLFVFQVRQSEVAIVTTFGKVTGEPKKEPGAYFKLPWPIQTVCRMDQRIQNFEGPFEEITLADQNILFVQVYTGWRIADPKLFFPKFLDGRVDQAEKTLSEFVQSARNEVVARHPFSDFISANTNQLKFAEIEKEMLDKVSSKVRDYGIEVKFIQIKKLGLPEDVTKNVFDRMQKERERLVAKIQSEGEESATKIRSDAETRAANLLSSARAQAEQIRGEAVAEMMKSLSVLEQNPELAKLNLKLEALKQMLKQKTTLILDQNTPPLDLLNNVQTPKTDQGKK